MIEQKKLNEAVTILEGQFNTNLDSDEYEITPDGYALRTVLDALAEYREIEASLTTAQERIVELEARIKKVNEEWLPMHDQVAADVERLSDEKAELERQVKVLRECAEHYANRAIWRRAVSKGSCNERLYVSAVSDLGCTVAQRSLAETAKEEQK